MEIVISRQALTRLCDELTSPTERGAAVFMQRDQAGDRYLVQAWDLATGSDVISSSEVEIVFSPAFLTRTTRIARASGRSIGLLHTHPIGADAFSVKDDQTETRLLDFMRGRIGDNAAFAFVLCDGVLLARVFGTKSLLPVRVVGSSVSMSKSAHTNADSLQRFDRQVRAFGRDGQDILNGIRVAVVGLGGTGSVTAQQLAHLGVRRFVLIDSDVVESTNLNRIVGANDRSVGRLKVDVCKEMIQNIAPSADVVSVPKSAISDSARAQLCQSDCIFICTDSHTSRAFIAELAYQYMLPAIDVGVSISAQAGIVSAITGRAQMVGPGLPCLLCCNAVHSQRIREELMTPAQRAADPYFIGDSVKQPAVVSINSTVVSLAVTMFLSAFVGLPSKARWLSYDGIAGTTRPLATSSDPGCAVCGPKGVVALGDSSRLSFIGLSHEQ
jgi:molybdopterin/thiamine biosynthesis adenylyltransferase